MTSAIPKNRAELEASASALGLVFPYSDDLSPLARPLDIRGRSAANRIAYQAMEGCDGRADGAPDTLTVRRYRRFAHGGPGIIWFEATAVLPEARANPRQLYLTEKTAPEFARLVEEIKEICVKENGFEPLVIIQLTNSGRYSKPNGVPEPLIAYNNPLFEKSAPIDPGRIVSDGYLDRTGEAIASAALLAERCGFDGADIKSCHRYLLCELLSAYTRPGRYGGCYENRTRLLRETAENIISSVSPDFIVSSRLNAYDGFPYPYGFGVREGDGIEPDFSEAIRLVGELEALGMPLVNITMGNPYVNPHVNRPFAKGGYDPGEHPLEGVSRMLGGISLIASSVGIPVISSGLSYLGVTSANVAAACVGRGDFAFAGYGRMTLAYPDIARDICAGAVSDKVCIACSGCSMIMRAGGQPGCIVRDGGVYMPLYRQYVPGN